MAQQNKLLNPDISDEDVLEAMKDVPGYLDISVEDFRSVYVLAREHARNNVFTHISAGALMHGSVQPLHPDDMLDQAARHIVAQGHKALPVAKSDGQVIGMLTETDFLRRIEASSFLELMLRMLENPEDFRHRFHETPVSAAMSAPVVSISEKAGFSIIAAAFRSRPGRSLPVVDEAGRMRGLLLRQDFIEACHLEPLI